MGYSALYKSNNASDNTAFGTNALGNTSTGSYNTAIGEGVLYGNITGDGNAGLGYGVLKSLSYGNNNTGLGTNADVAFTGLSNATAVGAYSSVACNNCMVLGSINGINAGTSNIKVGIGTNNPLSDMHIKQSNETYPVNAGGLRLERKSNANHWDVATDNTDDIDFTYNGIGKGYINHVSGVYTATSDLRLKKDVQLIGLVMPKLLLLQAKTYHYKDNQNADPLSYGFIAQEVEKLFPDFVTTKGANGMKAIGYQNFSVIAIKAIQEQQEDIEILKDRNKIMEEQIIKLQAAMEALIQKTK